MSQQSRDAWLVKAREHRELLLAFVRQYHPNSDKFGPKELSITAEAAEFARQNCVAAFQSDDKNDNPVQRLEKAFDDGSIDVINKILNVAWFGVPESTSCWHIPGFPEAVELMETDPSYDESEASDAGL